MQNFPDHDFDSWINKALEDPKINFDPEAWKLMEKKLDEPVFPWWNVLIHYGSLFSILFVMFYLINYNSKNEAVDKNTFFIKKNDQKSSTLNIPEEGIYKNNSSKVSIPSISEHSIKNSEKTGSGILSDSGIDKNYKNKVADLVENHALQPDFIYSFNNSDDVKDKNTSSLSIPLLNLKFYNIDSIGLKTLMRPIRKTEIPPTPFISSTEEQNRRPKFNLGVFVSPDISSVNFKNISGSGLSTGFNFEWYITPKWRVSTGIIKSNKLYDVNKDGSYGYTPPAYTTFEGIDATCNVIDIPINIRYNIIPKGNGGFFISSGLSSYFMLKEDYSFNYKYYNNDYTENLSIKNQNRHLFQIVNLSLGYEKELGNRFSIQAEPFLKIPLQNVGYGKVKLLSTGAFISLRYKVY